MWRASVRRLTTFVSAAIAIAVLNADCPGEGFFQIHPAYHSAELISEMVDVAEAKLPKSDENGKKELIAFANTLPKRYETVFYEQ